MINGDSNAFDWNSIGYAGYGQKDRLKNTSPHHESQRHTPRNASRKECELLLHATRNLQLQPVPLQTIGSSGTSLRQRSQGDSCAAGIRANMAARGAGWFYSSRAGAGATHLRVWLEVKFGMLSYTNKIKIVTRIAIILLRILILAKGILLFLFFLLL